MSDGTNTAISIYADPSELARATAEALLQRLTKLQARQPGAAHLALTGGTVGTRVLAEVAQNPLREDVDWSRVHLWWGDERFLPPGDPDRNETQARGALITALGDLLPDANVHPVPGPGAGVDGPAAAAARYARELAAFAPAGALVPRFDVLLLGMGPDGHVASLFPGKQTLQVRGVAAVAETDSPKPPSGRVSLTFDAINSASQVWVVAAGAEKAEAVGNALGGARVADTPAAGVRGRDVTEWRLDEAAARNLRRAGG